MGGLGLPPPWPPRPLPHCARALCPRVLFCSPVDSHRAALLQCASHHPRILRLGVPRLGTSALTLRRHGVARRHVTASAAERLPLNLPEGPRVHLPSARVIGSGKCFVWLRQGQYHALDQGQLQLLLFQARRIMCCSRGHVLLDISTCSRRRPGRWARGTADKGRRCVLFVV